MPTLVRRTALVVALSAWLLQGCGGSHRGMPSQAATAAATRQLVSYHPADTNSDRGITINELTGYIQGWKVGQFDDINLVTNAITIWKGGETYHYDNTLAPPYEVGAGNDVLAAGDQSQATLQVQMPTGSPLGGGQTSVVTFFDGASTDTSGQATVTVSRNGGGIAAAVEDATGSPFAFAYIPPTAKVRRARQDGTPIAVGAREMAFGLICLNPYVLVLPPDQRNEVLLKCEQHADWQALLTAISTALKSEPKNAFDANVFPDIPRLAFKIIKDVLSTYGITARRDQVDANGDPHINDPAGPLVTWVNPRQVAYEVDVTRQGAQSPSYRTLVTGREGVLRLQLGWPPVVPTSDITQDYSLGNGSYTVDFYKGFNFGEVGLDTVAPRGVSSYATYCNLMRASLYLISLLADLPAPTGQQLAQIVLAADAIDFANTLADEIKALQEGDVYGAITGLCDILSHNNFAVLKDIMHLVWSDLRYAPACRLLASAKAVLGTVCAAFKAVDWANEKLPFFYDLLGGAPSHVRYHVVQTNGVLSLAGAAIPPTAGFTASPSAPTAGQTVTFDAAGSSDPVTATADLVVRWDFDGDGTWDVAWQTAKTVDHPYPVAGTYQVFLEVKNAAGLIGRTYRYVTVASNGTAGGTAQHVLAFRDHLPWDSGAFETVMGDLGFTAGTAEGQYEVRPSSDLATVVLRPQYDLVIITNDQDQSFYNHLAAAQDRVYRFLEAGGTVLWEACDLGWAEGSMAEAGVCLPRGVTTDAAIENYNACPGDKPLTADLPTSLYGTYASHERFGALPADAVVYTNSADNGAATLFEMPVGPGKVIVTGQPWEYQVDRDESCGLLYPRVFQYVTGRTIASRWQRRARHYDHRPSCGRKAASARRRR